jgi:hypothetical protein
LRSGATINSGVEATNSAAKAGRRSWATDIQQAGSCPRSCGISWVASRLISPSAQKTNSPRRPLRPRTPRRNEQRRSSRYEVPPLHSILSQLEDDGTQSITSRLWPHSLRVQLLHRKCPHGARRLWVNRITLAVCRSLPVCTQLRTWRCTAPTDVMCQRRTSCVTI